MPIQTTVTYPKGEFLAASRGYARRAARWANRQSAAEVRDELRRAVSGRLRRTVRSRSSGDKARVRTDFRAKFVLFGTVERRTRSGARRGRITARVNRGRLYRHVDRRWPPRFDAALVALVETGKLPRRGAR